MKPQHLVLAGALALATAPTTPAQQAPVTRFRGTVEVTTVNVDVVATRHGEPVTDLTAADFTVLEDGQEREITNFARVVDGEVWLAGGNGAAGGGASVRSYSDTRYRGRVVLLFDLNNTTRPRLSRALDAATEYVESHAAEDLDWSVAVVGTKPRVVLAYTADTARVVRALAGLVDEPTSHAAGPLDRSEAYEPLRTETSANLQGEISPSDTSVGGRTAQEAMVNFATLANGRESLRALGRLGLGLVQILEGSTEAPGRKVCLIFTGGLDIGLDAEASLTGGGATPSLAQRRSTELHELQRQVEGLVEELGRLASTAGFTLYTVNTAGLQQPSLGFAAEHGGRTSARDETSGPTSLDPTSPTSDPDAIPRTLAEETGGRHFNGNDLTTSLEEAHRAATTYYSLGFASEPRGEGDYREIKVKVRRPGVHLEFRPGLYERDPEDALAGRMAAPLALQQGTGAVPVKVTAHSRPDTAGLAITASLETPLDRLTLLPEQSTFSADLAILLAVYDRDGRILDLKRQHQRVAVPADRLAEAQGQPFTTALRFTLPEGSYTVSMAVLDRGAGAWGLATTAVEPAPAEPEPSPTPAPRAVARSDEPLEARLAQKQATAPPAPRGLSPEYEHWPDGPEGVLLSKAERSAWSTLTDDDAARAAAALFWARRDPDATTPENEARQDFDARVSAADEQFTTPEQRGALSDRGRVLILLGRPASVLKAADLTTETWIYGRDQLPQDAPLGRREKRLKVPFRRGADGEMQLAPEDDAARRVVDGTLAAARTAWITHPELTRAPTPSLFLSAPAASTEQLAALATAGPWPEQAAAATVPELFAGQNPRAWVTLRLPSALPAGDALIGLLMDAERQPLGSFRVPARPFASARGTVYQLSLPVTRGSTRLRLGVVNGGVVEAATELTLATPTPPPNATWIAPAVAGAELGRQRRFAPWDPFLYGGHRLVPRLDGRYAGDETLYWFTEVLRPGHRPQEVPQVDLDIEVLRGTRVVASHRENGLELSMMAPDTFIIGSSFPLAALPGPGVYRLVLTVSDPVSRVVRTTELPVIVTSSEGAQ